MVQQSTVRDDLDESQIDEEMEADFYDIDDKEMREGSMAVTPQTSGVNQPINSKVGKDSMQKEPFSYVKMLSQRDKQQSFSMLTHSMASTEQFMQDPHKNDIPYQAQRKIDLTGELGFDPTTDTPNKNFLGKSQAVLISNPNLKKFYSV